MRRKLGMGILLAAVVMAAAGCGSKAEEEATASASGFESFTATTLEGEEVTQAVFAEYDLTMVNIWGTFCGPCITEMPELAAISREYEDMGVQVVGVVVDAADSTGEPYADILEDARNIVEETGADYMHILPSKDLIASKLSQVSAVPETVFVDKEGRQVGRSYTGARMADDWKVILDGLLEEVTR